MKKGLPIAALVAAALALQLTFVGAASATKAIADQEQAACTVCHDKPGSKLMTDRGKYWESIGTFEGYEDLQANFGQCTFCHVRSPGSAKLTKKGTQYKKIADDMEGLREWLMRPHPKPAPEQEEPADSERR